jgi:hypothetical protein
MFSEQLYNKFLKNGISNFMLFCNYSGQVVFGCVFAARSAAKTQPNTTSG